ncbi:MAG: hypothetical protein PHO37_05165 [Kiritimatiellae bacterium]|nr:hypothetical protein [Kiritimatiellia bacterium]
MDVAWLRARCFSNKRPAFGEAGLDCVAHERTTSARELTAFKVVIGSANILLADEVCSTVGAALNTALSFHSIAKENNNELDFIRYACDSSFNIRFW